MARLGRTFHPLRVQHWAVSDLNPMMWPLAAMASTVKANRKPAEEDNPWRKIEETGSEWITASWNLYRDLRDATSESAFFQIYGSMIALGAAGDVKPGQPVEKRPDSRELPFVKEALAAIEKGGYPEALARIGALLGQYAGPIPLDRLSLTDEIIRSDKVLSKISVDEGRRLRSEAGVMVLMEPQRTLKAIPSLLSRKEDRQRVLQSLESCRSMEGITKEQRDMLDRITALLSEKKAVAVAGNSTKKKAKKK